MNAKAAQRLSGFSLSKNAKFVIYSQFTAEHAAAAGSWVSTNEVDAENAYYSDADVATLLGISVAGLRNKISAGDPLPPRLQAAGIRKRLWPCHGLHEWLKQFEETQVSRQTDGFHRRF